MNRPQPEEYAAFYKTYIDTVGNDVFAELEIQLMAFPDFLKSLSSHSVSHAYAEGKWTVKELVGHVVDTERIMTYRALRIARNDQTPLAGFEENEYVANAHFSERTMNSLADEFAALRFANIFLLKSFSEIELKRTGTCNNIPISVKALVYIIAGHVNHHRRIIEERYL